MTVTYEEKIEENIVKVKTDKMKVTFTILPNRYGFFQFEVDSGHVPPELKGQYMNINAAKRGFERFEASRKETESARIANNRERAKAFKEKQAQA